MTKQLLIAATALSLAACSSLAFWKDDAPLQMQVNIEAANNINPNIDSLASPLEIRIYQLKDSEAFNQAVFIDLYNDDQGVLKADLLSKRNLDSLLPAEKRQVTLPLITETKFVAVIAAFSDYRKAKSKAIVQIEPGKPASVDVRIDGINVSITGQED
ncbi:type VI secretion system lipoprotein TssJ [Psychromonas ossibalaenae]|uniref:type VI secretion system lipoprotein TssJ n=1 Tax=Psychromonas ossibalaenae TaxID=444922 RepID=UPI00037C0BFC|nr:type VI secretion system lipoprotein TssJ [Psychromonas ossibalaenae]